MKTIQLIKTRPYEEQGLIDFDGEPEPLACLYAPYIDKVEFVERGLKGWGEYTRVAWVTDDYGHGYYYLVPDVQGTVNVGQS